MGLLINAEVHSVLEYHHVKPGKGSAFVRVKLKHIKTGNSIEKTFRASDKLEDVPLEEKRMQFLYVTGDAFHFMDQTTFEETVINRETLGDQVQYLLDNLEVKALCYAHQVLKLELPTFIMAKILETEPGFKGDTSRSGYKPAKIETNVIIQVPLFINRGDLVKIDTRTGEYVERVKE